MQNLYSYEEMLVNDQYEPATVASEWHSTALELGQLRRKNNAFGGKTAKEFTR